MTNYNERLDKIIADHREWMRGIRTDHLVGTSSEATKQAITSLNKELVAEAKPANLPIFGSQNEAGDVSPSDYEAAGYNQAIKEFEQNLLKELEDK